MTFEFQMSPYYMLTIGIILVVASIILFIKRIIFLVSAQQTIGTVVEIVEKVSFWKGRYRTYFYPKVCYTIAGKTFEITGNVGSASKRFKTGQPLKLYYVPNQPEKAIITNIICIWGLPLCFLFIGIVGLYGGLKEFMRNW